MFYIGRMRHGRGPNSGIRPGATKAMAFVLGHQGQDQGKQSSPCNSMRTVGLRRESSERYTKQHQDIYGSAMTYWVSVSPQGPPRSDCCYFMSTRDVHDTKEYPSKSARSDGVLYRFGITLYRYGDEDDVVAMMEIMMK